MEKGNERAMRIAGLIIAGGAASRLGGSKALLPFLDGTVLDAVIGRVSRQVSPLALNVPKDGDQAYRARYAEYPLVFDPYPERVGPLAGVVAGLAWAHEPRDVQWLATFPCDTPFLARDLVAQLMIEAREAPVFAHDGDRLQGVCAVWPLRCLGRLRDGVQSGRLRSLHSAMEALGGKTRLIKGDEHAFLNINTHADLARAEEIARTAQQR